MSESPQTEINSTKRKLIQKDMASLDVAGVVLHSLVLKLASKYRLAPPAISRFLVSMGYRVEPPPVVEKPAPKPKAPEARTVHAGVPPEVISTILRGGIYKKLDDDPRADPSTVFVVTTLDKFLKEREAICKLLQSLKP